MMLKTVMEVAQDCTVFKYGPTIPQKDVKSRGIIIFEGSGVCLTPTFVLPGNSKYKVGKEPPPPPNVR